MCVRTPTYWNVPEEAYERRTDTQSFFMISSYFGMRAREDNNVSTAFRNGHFLSSSTFEHFCISTLLCSPFFCSEVLDRGSVWGSVWGSHIEGNPLIDMSVSLLMSWDKDASDRTDGSILKYEQETKKRRWNIILCNIKFRIKFELKCQISSNY